MAKQRDCFEFVKKVLLDFAFFILDVLARNRVILPHNHFLCHCTRVFFRYIEMSCSRARIQADFDCSWLRHVKLLRQNLKVKKTIGYAVLLKIVALSTVRPIFLSKFYSYESAGGL